MITTAFRIGMTISILAYWPVVGSAEDTQSREIEKKYVNPRVFPDPKMAAEYGLKELRKIGLLPSPKHEMFAKSLGFLSAKETLVAELGVGLRTYDVSLNRLKTIQGDHDQIPSLS